MAVFERRMNDVNSACELRYRDGRHYISAPASVAADWLVDMTS